MHSFDDFCAQVPKAAGAYCASNLTPFARSSFTFLRDLREQAFAVLGDHAVVLDDILRRIPKGNCVGVAIVDTLLDAAKLSNQFESIVTLLVLLKGTPGYLTVMPALLRK